MPADPEAVRSAARELRALFAARRSLHLSVVDPDNAACPIHPSWDGVEDSRGIKRGEVWPGLAAFALANNLDQSHWVQTLFSMAYALDHVPGPLDLKRQTVLSALASSADRRYGDLVHRLKSEYRGVLSRLHHARTFSALPTEKLYKTVLAHPELDASPVVRFLVARSADVSDVASAFRPRASLQYASSPEACAEAFPGKKQFLSELADDTRRAKPEESARA